MSAFNKLKEFEEKAELAEKELLEASKEEADPLPPETEPDPATTEPPTETPAENEWEKKYKDALKGMNEAQRKAADAAKVAEEAAKKNAELEAKVKEALERAQKIQETSKVEPEVEDELEAEMPEVVKIADRKARKAVTPLEARLEAMEKRLEAEKEFRQKMEAENYSRQMVKDIVTVHPDYHDVANSEEMTAWINNEAPPIYRAIFEGKIQFTAKDAIAVIDAFKATQVKQTAKPGAAEMGVNTKPSGVATQKTPEKPLTEKELTWFMHNSHRLKPEELASWEERINKL